MDITSWQILSITCTCTFHVESQGNYYAELHIISVTVMKFIWKFREIPLIYVHYLESRMKFTHMLVCSSNPTTNFKVITARDYGCILIIPNSRGLFLMQYITMTMFPDMIPY